MKKTFLVLALATSFVACKSKTDAKLDSNKDLILLADSSRANGSYLSDTGVTATAATRNAVEFKANETRAVEPKRTTSSSSNTSSTSSSSNSSSGTTASAPAAAPAKKGISKAAKGAIIGGVGGAVVGGIIGKNVKGAVIGGAVGAGGGYIIGRSKDKKDGRVQ